MKVIGLVAVLLFCGETVHGRSRPRRQDSLNATEESCIGEARRGRCEFFKCFHERHPCQSNNYAMDYGWRFCSRFQINMFGLSDAGKRWLNGSRLCTMERLLDFYYQPTVSCDELTRTMKDAQAACEVENGLCRDNLLRDNREVFTEVHNLGAQSASQFLHATKHCVKIKARMVDDWFRDRLEDITEHHVVRDIRHGLNSLRQKFSRIFGRNEDTEALTDWSWAEDDINGVNGFGIGFDDE